LLKILLWSLDKIHNVIIYMESQKVNSRNICYILWAFRRVRLNKVSVNIETQVSGILFKSWKLPWENRKKSLKYVSLYWVFIFLTVSSTFSILSGHQYIFNLHSIESTHISDLIWIHNSNENVIIYLLIYISIAARCLLLFLQAVSTYWLKYKWKVSTKYWWRNYSVYWIIVAGEIYKESPLPLWLASRVSRLCCSEWFPCRKCWSVVTGSSLLEIRPDLL